VRVGTGRVPGVEVQEVRGRAAQAARPVTVAVTCATLTPPKILLDSRPSGLTRNDSGRPWSTWYPVMADGSSTRGQVPPAEWISAAALVRESSR
jgi:hypothetical protein